MKALSFDRVTILRGARAVLQDVSLDLEPGEFVGMLGANGSGKTTLMRAVLGLQPLSAGAIRVGGAALQRGNPGIGYMPQARSNIANMRFSGWDCVAAAAGGGRWGLPILDAEGKRSVDRALDLVGARDLARRPLREMSGGERQRLLLSQALIGNPRLLLLDEPLINLDPTHQHAVIDVVRSLQKELKLTVLFSAHEVNPLLGAIDRVLYLANGHAALGTVDEVITSEALSRLYGSDIEVIRFKNRIFVMAGQIDLERNAHSHDHDEAHDHAHEHHDSHGDHSRAAGEAFSA